MKNLRFLLLFIILPSVYFYIYPVKKTQLNVIPASGFIPTVPGPQRDFINGIFNFDPQLENGNWLTEHMDKYKDELHFNMIHSYDNINGGGLTSGNGTNWYGYFDQPLTTTQKTNIKNVTDAVESEGLNMWYERCKISKLCYAQRLVYEVIDPRGGLENNGFCYQYCEGDYITDAGNTVLHLTPSSGAPSPVYIAKDIKENLQHGDNTLFNIQQADRGIWYIKPRMKIPVNTPDNKEVVRIEVVNYEGDVIKTIILTALNFKDNGTYNGDYIEKYFNLSSGQELEVEGGYHTDVNKLNSGMHAGDWIPWQTNCSTDFRIKWMDEVEVWFDKTTVDDVFANNLFDPNPTVNYDDEIEDELDFYKAENRSYTFFADECLYSNLPCIKYVQDKIEEYSEEISLSPAPTLHTASSHFLNVRGTKEDELAFSEFLKVVEPKQFSLDVHVLYGWRNGTTWEYGNWIPNTIPLNKIDSRITTSGGNSWITSYDTYNTYVQDWLLGHKNQSTLYHTEGSLVYQIELANEQIEEHSPDTKLILQPQIQGILVESDATGDFIFGAREPFNEEIQAQAMVSIAHGADGICWYIFQSELWNSYPPLYARRYDGETDLDNASALDVERTYGLQAENMIDRRTSNLYSQDKWNYVANMNSKIASWKPTLDAVTWKSGWSVHTETANHEFINNIVSIDPHRSGQNPCVTDFSSGISSSGPWADCDEDRYWEMGFFEDIGSDKYFIMVNRRCAPAYLDATPPVNGDDRVLRVKFNLSGPINWTISEVGGTTRPIVFNRNSYTVLGSTNSSMGWFKPGEGKLFKLSPTIETGGELVVDEDISGGNYTCLDTIYNGGFNITIDSATTISFTDSACIIMTGGVFQSGVYGQNQLTTYKGAGSNKWPGLSFTGSTVKIYNSKFQDISSPAVNYAVKMYNCPVGDIRTNQFVMSTDTSGAVQSNYVYSLTAGALSGLYMSYNSVTMNNSRGNAFAVQGYSGLTIPVYIANNTMSSNGYASGMLLSTVTGGMVKQNSLTGFSTGINALQSTIDLFGNTISNTSGVSTGIFGASSTSLTMYPAGGTWLGGFNNITNTSGASKNLRVDNSVFNIDIGYNSFDISNTGYHIYGTFWDGSYNTAARYNCFKISGDDISPGAPTDDLTDGYNPISLGYGGYECAPTYPPSETVVDIGGGNYDTIPTNDGFGLLNVTTPSAGGSNFLPITKGETERGSFTLTPSQLYDSVRINLTKRNYTVVKEYCEFILNSHASSPEAILSLQPLYLAATVTDSTTSGRTALKNYFAALILNNGENSSLVKVCHYLSLKCMVLLGEYTSALNGFQQIMNNNPYNYEGLVAKWDYMATSLIAPGGGSYSIDNEQWTVDNLQSYQFYKFDEFDEYEKLIDDKNPLTKKQREDVNTSIKNVFETTKEDNNTKIKILEGRSDKGDESAKHELSKMRVLKDAIRLVKPKNMSEHLSIVSSDVQKVFGNTSPTVENKTTSVPRQFSLSQNYPNPFNPTTTIRYALPLDVKVTIKIYDILGREVKQLVNEVQPAGYYDIKFDGSHYASGVYFYRIEAGEFVVAKKMVLVK